ncbi:MAG TPA: hypothetical protein VI112_14695 [Bacteroidia bacterium]
MKRTFPSLLALCLAAFVLATTVSSCSSHRPDHTVRKLNKMG